MDEIEVDPKLFVTCRLCLEDLGQYQIVPTVQQQIKYCFDIEVEPFDGLPQLICMKCKEILNKYNTIKKTFCDKQTNLIDRVSKKEIQSSIQPQQDTVSSSQQPSENIDNSKKPRSKKKRVLQSSSDSESVKSLHSSKPKTKSKRRVKTPMPWEADYKKCVSCKLCNSVWSKRRSLANHFRCHDGLRERYKNIFNRQCRVSLNKIDGKPNLTGLNSMVVYNSNTIIAPGNSYFYTIYSKEGVTDTTRFNSTIQNVQENKRLSRESSDDDDDDDGISIKLTQRKNRLISRSSNETVVIASNSNKVLSDFEDDSKSITHDIIDEPLNNDQCINIDDSSDNDSDQGKLEKSRNIQARQPMEAKLGDYKIIQGIISTCVVSYRKKMESAEVDVLNMNVDQNKKRDNIQISNESQLKHKLLSIGRKIITKQGFNCTGLLRYMEHKSLEIVWMAKTQLSHSKETNYIRILTKLRGNENTDGEAGWFTVSEISKSKSSTTQKAKNTPTNKKKAITTVPAVRNDSIISNSSAENNDIKLANVEKSQPEYGNDQAKIDVMPAILYIDSKASSSDSKKLLNANPVANPKQLPKKLGPGGESRPNKTPQSSNCHTTNDDVKFCLPIITSTTSLATVPNKEQNQDSNPDNKTSDEIVNSGVITNSETPRIKVKPVSELMSERTLNSLMKEQATPVTNSNMLVSQIENVWPHQRPVNVFVSNIAPQLLVTSPPIQILQIPHVNVGPSYQVPNSVTSNTKEDYLILDTTDFPNTKTLSPFRYFMDLLQIHKLVLLDSHELLSKDFICLIKFKVLFKQECQSDAPVKLCLSFFCLQNKFCLQFKDRNNQILDISKISANWQWELLQIYRGEVSNKVLLNAQRVGQETFDFTNNFLCLLKSISCRKP